MTRDEAIDLTKKHLRQHGDVAAAHLDWLVALGAIALETPRRHSDDDDVRLYLNERGIGWTQTEADRIVTDRPLEKHERREIERLRRPGLLVESPMTLKTCEPPPEHRGKTYHWLRAPEGDLQVHAWDAGGWSGDTIFVESDDLWKSGWRYVAPCEEPRFKPAERLAPTGPGASAMPHLEGALRMVPAPECAVGDATPIAVEKFEAGAWKRLGYAAGFGPAGMVVSLEQWQRAVDSSGDAPPGHNRVLVRSLPSVTTPEAKE
ncbi:MAG TPA: hypothetical protein VIU44_07935 [Gaiellaceae bacterium]